MRQTTQGYWIPDHDFNLVKGVQHYGIEWEQHLLPHLERFTKPGKTVVDVGAHIGDTATSFMRHSGGYVVAYEPEPTLFECLIRNSPNSVNYQIALSDVEGTSGYVHIQPGREDWESGRLVGDGESGQFSVITVPLDVHIKRWPELPEIGLIKIDVDGSELRVLEGARKTISKYRPDLIVEICPWFLGMCGTRWQEIRDFLEYFEYKCSFHYGFGIENGWPGDLVDWTEMDMAVQTPGRWYSTDVYCTKE